MMATCHVLYHEGAKIILRNTPVSFDEKTSESKALSLLRFIQAEHLSRCSYIRELHLLMTSVPDVLAMALVQLVPRMISLKVLSVAIEDALESYPELLFAFSSLQSVENLLVANAGEHSCALVRSLQSPIVEAEIFYGPTSSFRRAREDLSSKTECHPLVMLQHSAATLTTLVAGFLVDSNIQLVFVRPPDITFPLVHTLILHECTSLTLTPYVKCLPNLTHLCIRYRGQSPWDDHDDHGHGQIPGAGLPALQREMNLTLPGRLDPATQYGPPAWKRLDEYIGPLMDLWVLGLTCPIACLKLEDGFARLSSGARAPTALTDVLAYARPTELAIVFRRCTLTDFLATDFLDALATEGAAGLRSLMVAVWVREGDRDLDMGPALVSITLAAELSSCAACC
uniref:pH-response regulator protein palF/RIM8 n=1 Tax=Ganoderma boninense TaxID=34458 RepID=A0A5K1JRZ1_9APHY|nr:pH-response regulator protein palF/RIM8 [Ganoderma boninense]